MPRIDEVEDVAKKLRTHGVRMIYRSNASHLGRYF
jgi:hypothetical protein